MNELNQYNSGMVAGDKLPPLPASDPEAIAQNRFSGFYTVGSRDFWKYSRVTHNRLTDKQKCLHQFSEINNEILCDSCHVGFPKTNVQAKNGKLLINNKEVTF